MAQDNFIHAKKMVDGLNESFLNHAKVVGESAVQVEKLYNLYVKAPSQMLTMVKSLNAETEKGAQSKKKLSEAEREALRLEKAVASQRQKLAQATSANARELAKLRAETNHKNREATQEGIINSKVIGTYQQLNLQRTQASRRLRDLLASEKASNAEIRRAQNEFNKLDARVRKADMAVRDHTKNVGNYRSALGGLGGQLRTLMAAFGLVGGVMLFARAMRDAVGVIREFDKQSATLSAILQVTREEMSGLTKEAQRLGAITVKTAGEITGLQIAYARLGFQQQEIINLTEATISGSIAMNSELSETANLVGAMVNTFDEFSTIDAPEIIDIMSLATARSALNFEKLNKGLPTVAGAANAAGVPFTRLVALLGKLSDAGIDVSVSSTALRNIFIESAKQGLSYEQILQKIKDSQDQLTASNDEFGKRAAVSATVLSKAIDSTAELDETLQGAAGTAQRMADKELDTLDGALQLLKSAWQGIILETSDANNITNILKGAVQALAENLGFILGVIFKGIVAWGLYKVAVMTASLQTTLLNKQLALSRVAGVSSAAGANIARAAWIKFNAVLKANALFLTIAAIAGLIAILSKLQKSISEVAKETNESTKAFLEQRKGMQDVTARTTTLADRYEVLKSKTELNKDEQIELNKIIKELAKNVPDAVTEFDKYGNALDINAGKVRGWIKVQADFQNLDVANKIRENEAALKSIIEQQDKLNKLNEKGNTVYIEGVGVLTKTEEGYKKLIGSRFGSQGILDLTEKEISLVSQTISGYQNLRVELEANIATLKGVETEQEKQQKAAEKAEAQRKTEVLIVRQLRSEISSLKSELADLTKNGYENLTEAQADLIKETRKLIEEKEAELRAILGTTKATNDKRKAVESILEPYQRYIDRLQAVRKEFERLHGIQMENIGDTEATTEALERYLRKNYDTSESVKELRLSVEELQDIFGSLNTSFFNIDFANLGTIFHGITEGFESAGDAAQAFGQIAIDVFGEITRAQNLNLENQIRNLEMQRNVEIEYAGDSSEARAAIEERFNKEKLRLQREQAKNSKAMATMEAIVSTAVAVVKALAVGPPQGFILAALVGALGAAQIATIASQPLPQFKDGVTGFEGGRAVLGDGGKQEPFTDGKGRLLGISPAKSTVFDLPKGANVYSSLDDKNFYKELNGVLGSNNIIPIPAGGNSLSREDVYQAMKKAIGDKPSETIVLDKNGFTVSMVRGAVKVNNLNNRVTVRGRNV